MMWVRLALSGLSFVLDLFGIGKKDERAAERADGERLARAETSTEVNYHALSEVRAATAARDDNVVVLAEHPDRLRDGSDPAASRYSGPHAD